MSAVPAAAAAAAAAAAEKNADAAEDVAGKEIDAVGTASVLA